MNNRKTMIECAKHLLWELEEGIEDKTEIAERLDMLTQLNELEEGDFMCNNCGGGFDRDEIKTDEDGDDYCTSCK